MAFPDSMIAVTVRCLSNPNLPIVMCHICSEEAFVVSTIGD